MFAIDRYGLFRIKYEPQSLGVSSFYSIPYTLTHISNGVEQEANIIINLVAKYLIELGNTTVNTTDATEMCMNLIYHIKSTTLLLILNKYN